MAHCGCRPSLLPGPPPVSPGKYFWRLTRDRHLVSLQPAQMHRFWRGLPLHLDSVDAVYERTSDHKIVFFKGERASRALCPPHGRGPACIPLRVSPTSTQRLVEHRVAGLLVHSAGTY